MVQCARQPRNWLFPVGLVVVIIVNALHGASKWNEFYTSAMLLLELFPFLVCAGIVASEVESGRAQLLQSLGISRMSFIICRILGAVAFCLLVTSAIQFVLGIYLGLTYHKIDWPGAVRVFLGSGICFLYTVCLLTAFSTMVRSWGNTLAAFLLCLLVPMYLNLYWPLRPSFMRVVHLISWGPIYITFMPPGAKGHLTGDLLIIALGMASFTALAVTIYQRSEIGRRANM